MVLMVPMSFVFEEQVGMDVTCIYKLSIFLYNNVILFIKREDVKTVRNFNPWTRVFKRSCPRTLRRNQYFPQSY